ncbi:MAG: hypothetical protein ACYS8Z_23585 [Planctomycetota bacterium]|jgi:hypothetical protein
MKKAKHTAENLQHPGNKADFPTDKRWSRFTFYHKKDIADHCNNGSVAT